jgi:hypothetical protein
MRCDNAQGGQAHDPLRNAREHKHASGLHRRCELWQDEGNDWPQGNSDDAGKRREQEYKRPYR